METALAVSLLVLVALAWVGMRVAVEKGYSVLLALGIMILTSPIVGLLIVMVLPKRENLAERKVRDLEMERMAILAEAIKKKQNQLASSGAENPTV